MTATPQWSRQTAETAIADALQALAEAANAAAAPTLPQAPFPRPPRWWGCAFPPLTAAAEAAEWRYLDASPEGRWLPYRRTGIWYLSNPTGWADDVAARIVRRQCHGQPARVLRALRALERDTRWLQRAAAGRQRMAQEILRQQARAAEQVTARGVASSL